MRPNGIAPKDRIVLPLDVPDLETALDLVRRLGPYVGMFKIGLELIYTALADMLVKNPDVALSALQNLRELKRTIGNRLFIDAKLHDIPATVKGAVKALARMDAAWINVHASAGPRALEAAVANKGTSLLFGVTVLTSHTPEECLSIFGEEPGEKVLQFANMLLDSKADGIICSPKELVELRRRPQFDNFMIATPGVRPTWAATNDQKRVMTPGEAIRAGADYLVIGRPILDASDKAGAAQNIAEEIRLAEAA